MKQPTTDATPAEVSCHVCHSEVPRAEAMTVEAQEYLYYFCGQGCYVRWSKGQDAPGSDSRRSHTRR